MDGTPRAPRDEVGAMEWRLEKLDPTERTNLLDELTDRLVARVRVSSK
jgi:hypothetical protein